jgi:hypothetical protein
MGKNRPFLSLFLGDLRQDFNPLAITLHITPQTGEIWAILRLMAGMPKYPQYPPKKAVLGHFKGIRWLFYRLCLFSILYVMRREKLAYSCTHLLGIAWSKIG